VTEAAKLAQPQTFDHLSLIGEQYGTLRRYTPEFLDVLKLKAAPAAQAVLDAIDVVREMNATGSRKVPEDAPTSFIKARWKPLVFTGEGIDRRFYEICALSELKNALRSGDISVLGSRQFRDFEDYLLPPEKFSALQKARALPIAINPDLDHYLLERVLLLNQQLSTVNRLALANELPDAIISATGLKITPQDPIVPESAQALIDQSSNLLPRIKITELLMDVDDWTGFTRHFVHLKSGAQVQDRTLLLSAILADAINLGLTEMAESSSGANYSKLSWLQAWHIRDETYSAGLADLVNVQFRHPFAANWGDGSPSSSDGQRFRAGGRAESTGHINQKYGAEPGRIERTLFILDWLQNVELRRRAHAGLNKGEARNALARTIFIHRLGEIRDRTFEQQRYRASGLNLVTAAIVLWNTVYLERAAQALRDAGSLKDDSLQQYMSPLGWEHVNLTGDYVWRQNRKVDDGQFRPLRTRGNP
jgi:hypothetical protein